ncbi:serine palmitoyltransferase small subunit A [Mauremys reevesii]|uniref:serine palmitoyltransferase small subunit A n=1 Tax=Mauremys reevesii TaxID=260615 RepID=UPI00193F8C12|nr:serine palmitoyltransferase small subunit A [Mauremys reevesii]
MLPTSGAAQGRGAVEGVPRAVRPGSVSLRGPRSRTQTGPAMALGSAWGRVSWLYYQYLLVTALYMLEPWERTVFNSMLISIVGMALYTGYVFMPQHIMAILHYFEIVQ